MAVDDGTYEDYIAIVETAHGIRLTPGQIGRLNARLDDEARFFPPLSFAEAMENIQNGTGPRISVRDHVLAVAAELEDER